MSFGAESAPSADAGVQAVTLAFGTPEGRLGLARLELTSDGDANALALLLERGQPVVASAHDGLRPVGEGWSNLQAGAVRVSVEESGRSWRAGLHERDSGWEVTLRAVSEPACVPPDGGLVRRGGVPGCEQLCAVEGMWILSGRRVPFGGLGQVGWAQRRLDPERVSLVRTVSAWLDRDRALLLQAVRPRGADDQAGEEIQAFLVGDGEPAGGGQLAAVHALDEARLSTTYDAEGRARRAGLELWPSPESELPVRLAGEARAHATLDLTCGRLHSASFAWRMNGHEGVGRYDLLIAR